MIERKRENVGRVTRERESIRLKKKNIERKTENIQGMSAKCNESNLYIAMKNFNSQVKVGPVYICTVCH